MSFDNKPLVSIITVNFNGARYLRTCIESILNQTYKEIEYLIIDGGSNDNSLKIIKEYEGFINYWHSKPDKGIYDAMNIGIRKSKGDIIGILNSDDFLYENAVKNIVNTLKKNSSSSYTVAPIDLCDKDGIIYGSLKIDTKTKRNKFRLFKMPAPHMSIYVLRNVFNEIGMYSLSYKYCSDYDFILRIMDKKYIPAELTKPIGVFRKGGRGGSLSTWIESYKIRRNFKLGFFLSIKIFLSSAIKTIVFEMYFNTLKFLQIMFKNIFNTFLKCKKL